MLIARIIHSSGVYPLLARRNASDRSFDDLSAVSPLPTLNVEQIANAHAEAGQEAGRAQGAGTGELAEVIRCAGVVIVTNEFYRDCTVNSKIRRFSRAFRIAPP